MSVRYRAAIYCEECKALGGVGLTMDPKPIREAAEEVGWQCDDEGDFCQQHRRKPLPKRRGRINCKTIDR